MLKNSCFWTVVLEKTLESPLNCKEIQPVHPKGDQSWVFIGMSGAETETPILGPPDVKSWLIWKDPDAGKNWGQEEKGTTEYEMVGWHHQLNGHEFGWAPGVGVGQGGLVCCSSWGRKELDMTDWLNWTEKDIYFKLSESIVIPFQTNKDFHMIVFPQKFPRNLHHTVCIQGKILSQGLLCKCHPLNRFNQITSCWLLLLRIY